MTVDDIIALILGVGAIVFFLYDQVAKPYLYFRSKSIPCMRPMSQLSCSAAWHFSRRSYVDHIRYMYRALPEAKIIGCYLLDSGYLLRHPDTIKQIAVKDFNYFSDHGTRFTSGRTDEDAGRDTLLGNMLFAMRGQKWRDMRTTLSPAFTGSKMRHMFELVANCGRSMVEFLGEEAKAGWSLEFNMEEIFWDYATDVIASVAFDIQVDSMRDPDNEFVNKCNQVLNRSSFLMEVKEMLAYVMSLVMPKVKLNLGLLNSEKSSNFKRLIMDIIEQRESQGVIRKDMLQILMNVRKGTLKHSSEEQLHNDAGFATTEKQSTGKSLRSRSWKDSELIAQCVQFCLAGFKLPSLLMAFVAYELTINPDIQNRLYKEIRDTDASLKGEPLSYEVFQSMEYMDMVVSEVLRKWPPVQLLDRYCTKDYMFDDDSGARFVIEEGSSIVIPVGALHHDPQYFSDPEKFDPERFSKENRSKIHPGTYIPFGIGPRNCIASRLVLMEVKSAVYHLLRDYSLEPTEKTEVPLKFKGEFQTPKNGIWLEFRPRFKQKIKGFGTRRRISKRRKTKRRLRKNQIKKNRKPDSQMDITLEETKPKARLFELMLASWNGLSDKCHHTKTVVFNFFRTCSLLLSKLRS